VFLISSASLAVFFQSRLYIEGEFSRQNSLDVYARDDMWVMRDFDNAPSRSWDLVLPFSRVLYAHTYVCMKIYTEVDMYRYICIYIYIYIYIYVYTHTYIYIYIYESVGPAFFRFLYTYTHVCI